MRLVTGMRAWTVQRATAVFMLGFLLWLAGALLVSPPDGYEQWRAFVARPAASIAFALFFAAVVFHVWVGVRDVVLDYVHRPWTLVILLGLVATALFAVGIWLALVLVVLHAR
jgi:succinate dehydrogenase / fumarate reductase membrane anchor subunit